MQWYHHVLAVYLATTSVVASPAFTKPSAHLRRTVAELDEAAAAEAHQQDETAIKAFSGTQIKVFLTSATM